MRAFLQNLLHAYPHLGDGLVEAFKSSGIVAATLAAALLLSRGSAVARCWILRVGFLTLAMTAFWQAVPKAYDQFLPKVRLEIGGLTADEDRDFIAIPPVMETSQPRVEDRPVVEAAPPSAVVTREIERELRDPIFAGAFWTKELHRLERNAEKIWLGGTVVFVGWILIRHAVGIFWLRSKGEELPDEIGGLLARVSESVGMKDAPGCAVVTGLSSPLMTGWRKAEL